MDLTRYAALFLTESREQLAAMSKALLAWERQPQASEPAITCFRAMHTFKGMAAAMGYPRLTELAHGSESLLEHLRHEPATGRPVFNLLFRVVDTLEQGIGLAVEGQDGRLEVAPLVEELAAAVRVPRRRAAPATQEVVPPDAPAGAGREIRVLIDPGAVMRGARAMLVVRKAESLGKVSGLRPPLAAFELDGFDGAFSFRLESTLSDTAVVGQLEVVGDVARVDVGEPQVDFRTEAGNRRRQIRVDLRRLDRIMNLASELVVAKGRLVELAGLAGQGPLSEVADRIGRIASDLYGEAVQTRLTPVWQVFDRFPRVVRDLASQLGKRVRFDIEGEDTLLDRAILDELGEPLIHLLRNAIDHGIEAPRDRARAGKPEEGTIRVSATGDRNTVLIRVSDDGAGVDRSRVLEAAIERGLVPPGSSVLPDELLLRVLSAPGFSTSGKVSSVSGRGMGMEAVTTRLRGLGGSVEVTSERGVGSEFTLRLPMTLAIVKALLARVGNEQYAIPLAGIAETVEFRTDRLGALEGRETFQLRDEVLPAVRLREWLGVTGAPPTGRPAAVIIEVGEQRAAVVVDALIGQQEILVEPFDAPRGTLPVFSGATLLGDGVPALIVDPAALVGGGLHG